MEWDWRSVRPFLSRAHEGLAALFQLGVPPLALKHPVFRSVVDTRGCGRLVLLILQLTRGNETTVTHKERGINARRGNADTSFVGQRIVEG